MGATAGYCRPVSPTDGRMSTWKAHIKRGTPSDEPGTDYYCPIGTPIRAASSGVVSEVGDSIRPATGYFVKVNLDDGRSVRYLHLSRRLVNVGQRVQWGEVIAYSGATGYGEADWSWNVAGTGGAHVHMTVFPTHRSQYGYISRGVPYTLDPETLMAPDQGSNGSDLALLRRQKENSMYIKGTSQADVYNVWTDPNGQVRLRVCLPSEASYAATGGLVVEGYDSTLMQLGADAGYGQQIVPKVAAPGLEVLMIQDGDAVTYALFGPGHWDETTDPDVANGWARVYNPVATNITYAEWNDRKVIGQGSKS
jgi:hypothetical protein